MTVSQEAGPRVIGAEEFDLSAAISVNEAARLLRGRRGKPPSTSTVRRWANTRKGLHPGGPDGPWIALRKARANNEILFMRSWVEEFERERSRLGSMTPESPTVRTSRQKERDRTRTKAELAQLGVKSD